jgi:CDP-paratose 2-epimerase
MKKTILVTGAGGLIGSEAVDFYCQRDFTVIGLENNQRESFFGPTGSTDARLNELLSAYTNFKNFQLDIRDRNAIKQLFDDWTFDAVIHTAAQPSHDKAASIPFEDFETNAVGTLNLLEALRQSNRDCAFT